MQLTKTVTLPSGLEVTIRNLRSPRVWLRVRKALPVFEQGSGSAQHDDGSLQAIEKSVGEWLALAEECCESPVFRENPKGSELSIDVLSFDDLAALAKGIYEFAQLGEVAEEVRPTETPTSS